MGLARQAHPHWGSEVRRKRSLSEGGGTCRLCVRCGIIREVLALAGASCDALVSLSPASCAISTQAELVKRLTCADLNSSYSPQKTLGRPTVFSPSQSFSYVASVHYMLFLHVPVPS